MVVKTKFTYSLGGKKIHADFCMYCWEVFCEIMDTSLDDIMNCFTDKRSIRAMRTVIYSGIQAYDYLNDKESGLTEKDVTKLVSKDPKKALAIVSEAGNCLAAYLADDDPVEDKKK